MPSLKIVERLKFGFVFFQLKISTESMEIIYGT